jgi:two-component SAPR family response regulator
MALLIDRKGGTLTSNDAISYLWEDEPVDEHLKTKYRKLAMGLKRTLQQYGIEHILINKGGVRSVNTNALTCDYYELLAGNTQYVQSFHNSYMSDYTWSERTLGTLWDFS